MGRADHRGGLFAGRWLVAAGLVVGCGDEVVGTFEGSGGASASGTGGGTTTSSDASSSGDPSGSSGSSTGGGPSVFEGPGCFSDDFEDSVIDPVLWNPWVEGDSAVEEIAGMLKFTPPTTGILDTGVVGAYQALFRFENGWVRTRVPMPPAPTRSVVLFLQVLDEADRLVSMQIAGSNIAVSARIGGVDQYYDEFPAAPYPQWIGIRAEGSLVRFEVSDDGVSFTELAVRDQPIAFESAAALIMAQTYGQDFEGGVVAVDDFEVCLQ